MTIDEYLKEREKLYKEENKLEAKLTANKLKVKELKKALHQGNKSDYMKALKGSEISVPGDKTLTFKSMRMEKAGPYKYAGTSEGAPNDKVFVVTYVCKDKYGSVLYSGCMDLDFYLDHNFYIGWKLKLGE